ncbi:hypothetical protein C8J56DRAFT_48469 [Mycena floridula]|nr:hypothetical protein C8J56DRAFT_48469 [Mycena floridula]
MLVPWIFVVQCLARYDKPGLAAESRFSPSISSCLLRHSTAGYISFTSAFDLGLPFRLFVPSSSEIWHVFQSFGHCNPHLSFLLSSFEGNNLVYRGFRVELLVSLVLVFVSTFADVSLAGIFAVALALVPAICRYWDPLVRLNFIVLLLHVNPFQLDFQRLGFIRYVISPTTLTCR